MMKNDLGIIISGIKIYIQNYNIAGDSCYIACKHSDLLSASDFEIIFQLLVVFWFLARPSNVLQYTLLVSSAATSTFI